MKSILGVLLLIFALSSCTREPLREVQNAMRLTAPPKLDDDLPTEPLVEAVATQIRTLERSASTQVMVFGKNVYSRVEYIEGLKRFLELAKGDRGEFFRKIPEEFDFYEVYGDEKKRWGDVMVTSYYEPLVLGALKKTAKFTEPLYRAPPGLIALDLALFDEKYAQDRKLRGRLVGGSLLPYYTRAQITADPRPLAGRGLELVWVDPIDAFFLEVQGSGTVQLPSGRLFRVGYAEKNGHRYESIGKFLRGVLPPDQITLHTIEAYLRTLPREQQAAILNRNPSYVFFRKATEAAATSIGVSATDGRTIATDGKFFPKGALAFLATTKPRFDSDQALTPEGWDPLARFVLDQDVGGAIQGGGRVDLFWGKGNEAKRFAGVMKQSGKLYYLAPKRPKI